MARSSSPGSASARRVPGRLGRSGGWADSATAGSVIGVGDPASRRRRARPRHGLRDVPGPGRGFSRRSGGLVAPARRPTPRSHHQPPQARAIASTKIHQRRLGRIPSSRLHRDRETDGRLGMLGAPGRTITRRGRAGRHLVGPPGWAARSVPMGRRIMSPDGAERNRSSLRSPKLETRVEPSGLNHPGPCPKLNRRNQDLPEFIDIL